MMLQKLKKDDWIQEDQAFDLFKYMAEISVKEFLVTDKMKEDIGGMTAQFLNGELKTGIGLYGRVGQGKTMFFETVRCVSHELGRGYQFRMATSQEIESNWSKHGDSGLKTYRDTPNLFIDDIGHEEEDSKHYGAKKNVIKELLFDRYNSWKNSGYITHFTTNLTPDAFTKRYGERVADRIRQMCQWQEWNCAKKGSFREVTELVPKCDRTSEEVIECKQSDEEYLEMWTQKFIEGSNVADAILARCYDILETKSQIQWQPGEKKALWEDSQGQVQSEIRAGVLKDLSADQKQFKAITRSKAAKVRKMWS